MTLLPVPSVLLTVDVLKTVGLVTVADVLLMVMAEGAIPLTEEAIKVSVGCLCPRCGSI
jgi:hypothetical protein